MTTRRRLLLVGLAALGLATTAQAQFHGPPRPGMGPGPIVPLLFRPGDLSAEQDAQVRQILDADRSEVGTIMKQLETAQSALADKLLQPGDVNPADIAPDVQTISALRQQLLQHEVMTGIAIRGLLSTEQLSQAAERHTKMEALRAEMMPPRGRMMPPPPQEN